jgi:hypothetical protein
MPLKKTNPARSKQQPGLVVTTTGSYFCTVHRNVDQSLELVTTAELTPPLSDLEDAYWVGPNGFAESVSRFERYLEISLDDLQLLVVA